MNTNLDIEPEKGEKKEKFKNEQGMCFPAPNESIRFLLVSR